MYDPHSWIKPGLRDHYHETLKYCVMVEGDVEVTVIEGKRLILNSKGHNR